MREYGYLEKMLDILTDPYTHRDLQNVRKNRKLETNIGKLFSLLADGFEVIHKNAELVRLWDDLEMLRAQSLTAMEPTLVYSAVQQVMPSTEF